LTLLFAFETMKKIFIQLVMKRAQITALFCLSFLIMGTTVAQEDSLLLPTDAFEEELFEDFNDFEDFESEEDFFLEPTNDFEAPVIAPPTIETEFDSFIEPPLALDDVTSLSDTELLFAKALPASATTNFTVVNISQNNADALETGARPGDVLRYEFSFNSETEDVKDYVAQVNVAGIDAAVDFTDVGVGVLENGVITFPSYSQNAPCNQVYTFFVQVKDDCGELDVVTVSAEDRTIRVNLNCGLTQTGPASSALWLWMAILGLAATSMMWLNKQT